MERALQDILKVHCYGCGALNEHGLQIKSFWAGDEVVCAWRPKAHHVGHPGILYGGMIASVVDCHCIWTASAHAHRRAGVELDGTPRFQYVTAALQINYRKPVPIEQPIQLRAHVVEFGERKAIVKCTVVADGVLCADAELVAVRMRSEAAADVAAAHAGARNAHTPAIRFRAASTGTLPGGTASGNEDRSIRTRSEHERLLP